MNQPSGRRKDGFRFFGGALLLAFFFLLFDRLLLLGLRAGADAYYVSKTASAFHVKRSYGRPGDGNALILGSSRARYAFSQRLLSERLNKLVFKEAQAGKFPKYNLYFYRKFRETMGPPRIVLYGLDYFMFEKRSAPLIFARLGPAADVVTMEPRGAVNEASPLLSRASWLFRLKPEIDDFAANLLGLERKSDPDAGEEDGAPEPDEKTEDVPASAVPDEGPIVERPARWRLRPYRAFPGLEGSYLKALLGELERDGVSTFLVIIPDHIGTNAMNFEPEKFRQDMEKLAARYRGAHVLDFNIPKKFRLGNPKMFRNGGWGVSNCHLSDRGMRIFSEKLAVEVNRILAEDLAKRAAGEKRP